MGRANYSLGRDLLTPPYRLLPWAVFAFAVLCFIFHPNGAIRSGLLADSDDYMRLNEVVNWLQGQGWYDLSHPRLSPGSHTIVHWARLLDIPIALIALPFVKMMGMENAVLLAAFIVPPATLGVLLWLSCQLAKPFVGDDQANLAAPLTLFTPLTIMNFVPGRVDHHGYEVLVAGFALLGLREIAEGHNPRRALVVTALILACGLWIGTEALPWVVLFIGCLAVTAAWTGGELLGRGAFFGIAFTLSTLLILVLAVPPADYGSLALSWFSLADVLFAVLCTMMLTGLWLVGKFVVNPWTRIGVLIVLGAVAAAVFCMMVPQTLHGPFADYDKFDATVALDSIGEAQPLIDKLRLNPYNYLQNMSAVISLSETLLLPLAGLIGLGFVLYKAKPRQRILFLPHGVFLAVAIGLTLFWQIRVGWFMQFLAVAPLTYVLVAGWKKAGRRLSGRSRFWAEIVLFLALGFIPTVLIPALALDAPVASDVVMFPAARANPSCPLTHAARFLSQSWGYGAAKHTIISSGNEGPELLFRTHHDVIAANFNVAGNEDVYNFFGARDDTAAQNIAKRWHADLILLCRSFPVGYARLNHARLGKTAFLTPASDGSLHLVSDPQHPTLIERLARGPIPAWLKPVEIPDDKDYLLFKVLP